MEHGNASRRPRGMNRDALDAPLLFLIANDVEDHRIVVLLLFDDGGQVGRAVPRTFIFIFFLFVCFPPHIAVENQIDFSFRQKRFNRGRVCRHVTAVPRYSYTPPRRTFSGFFARARESSFIACTSSARRLRRAFRRYCIRYDVLCDLFLKRSYESKLQDNCMKFTAS